jgi:prolycopene isomerase
MKHYPNFLRLAERPFNAVLRKIKMPEDAIDILNVYWTYVGTDYEHLSFIHMAWMFLEYVRLKPAICKGTAHEMSVSAIERLRQLGGEIWQNVEATKVVGNDKGEVIGVETSAGFVETNYVIANMNPETAYTKLLDKNIKVPDREIRRLHAETHGVRFFNAYVALNKSIEQLGIKDYTIFMPGSFDTKKNFEDSKHYEGNDHSVVVIYNVLNPDISPKGTTVMTFTIAYTEEVWDKVSQRDYVKKKEELFSHVMANFEHDTGIIIHDSIEEIELASPWTFARYLGTPEGTTYGYEITDWDTMVSRLMAIRKDEPIHGFKTVGAAGANGDGYSQTYINGELIANMLIDEMKEDGR